MGFFKNTYQFVLRLAAHKYALYYLFIISFVESIFFPIPPDIMLIPIILANRKLAFKAAFIATIASVLGGILGYYLGLLLFNEVAQPILEFYNQTDGLAKFRQLFNENGWLIVIGGGLTPIPYKIVTISAGAMELSLFIFILASIFSRGLRFFTLGIILWFFGDKIKFLLDKYFSIFMILVFILVILGFIIIGI